MFYRPAGSLNQRLDGQHYRGIVVDVDICISCLSVVLPKVEKCRITKTSSELSITLGPYPSAVGGPNQLRVAGVAHQHVQHTVDHQYTADFRVARSNARSCGCRRAEIFAPEIVGTTRNDTEPHTYTSFQRMDRTLIRRHKRCRTDHHHPK